MASTEPQWYQPLRQPNRRSHEGVWEQKSCGKQPDVSIHDQSSVDDCVSLCNSDLTFSTETTTDESFQHGFISANDTQESYCSTDDEILSDDFKQEREPPFDYPNPNQLRNLIDGLPPHDPSKIAWEKLLSHEKENSLAEPDWYPFRNELCLLLWLGRYNPSLNITRSILQYFLKLLRTLQVNGHLNDEYFVPSNATTIEKWWDFIPKPPQGLFVVCHVCFFFCFVYPCTFFISFILAPSACTFCFVCKIC